MEISCNIEENDNSLGSGADNEDNIQLFKEWLILNGARFDKIDWPSSNTASGIRGAVANEDIETNETMLYIPSDIMISPVTIFRDPIVGEIFRNNQDILRGDFLLTMFISYELSKGEESFWYPYLRILPVPGTISNWSQIELSELQDSKLVSRACHKKSTLQAAYLSIIESLNRRLPSFFTYEIYTFPRFLFAFNTIQARAFGRRLPWTALVPFADCLNHSNLQTKYDYNVDNNGTFRLFPTGTNHYNKGSEVFNSYGRRANDNLLLDYGFAMIENEWDEVVIHWKYSANDEFSKKRTQILRSHGYASTNRVIVSQKGFPFENLVYSRIAALTNQEISYIISDNQKYPLDQPLSITNEIAALTLLIDEIDKVYRSYPTTEEEDRILLEHLKQLDNSQDEILYNSISMNRWKLTSAVTYRLLRKQILSSSLRGLNIVLIWMKSLQVLLESGETRELSVEDLIKSIKPFYKYNEDLNQAMNHLNSYFTNLQTVPFEIPIEE